MYNVHTSASNNTPSYAHFNLYTKSTPLDAQSLNKLVKAQWYDN